MSAIEHPSVYDTCLALSRSGFEITTIPVDAVGRVDPAEVRSALREDTVLVTVMHANNEVGTIQPIAEIAGICLAARVPLHTDAVQTAGKLPIDVERLGADLLSLSGHKFYGPKGVGALYIRTGARVHAQITGGGQEKNRRSGTENVAGIVGMASALKLAVDSMDEETARESAMRDRLLEQIPLRVPESRVSGHPTYRLPNLASFCFRGVEGEAILLGLDQVGIAASAGSACSSGSLEPPRVILAMGTPPEYAHGTLRLSVGRGTSDQDVEEVLDRLPGVIGRLREIARPARV